MKYCCQGFELAVARLGKRGVSVGATEHVNGVPTFLLELRAVDATKETGLIAALENIEPQEEFDLCYVSQQAIRFCPWCGTKLARNYRNTWREIEIPSLV